MLDWSDMPRCCPGCGKSYTAFRTPCLSGRKGKAMQAAFQALYVDDPDCAHQGYATDGDRKAWMHDQKVTAWLEHIAACIPSWLTPADYGMTEPLEDDSADSIFAAEAPADTSFDFGANARDAASDDDWIALCYRVANDLDTYAAIPTWVDPDSEPTERIPLETMAELVERGYGAASQTA